MESLLQKAETFYERYEGRVSSFALVLGFIFDSLTLQRIDLLFENVTILSYLVMSGGGIVLLNYYNEHPPQKSFFVSLQNFLPLFIQFAFGGLFSAFFIFYTRSATWSLSGLFILILFLLLIGNEFFREHYQRLTFQVSVYFVAIFSFAIFFVPVLLKTMGALVFMLSGVVSLLFISLFFWILLRVASRQYEENKESLRKSIFSIFILVNILYFSNLIPPIPLALKEAGVYYSIEKMGESYKVVGEEKEWYESLPFSPEIVHPEAGASLYIFSSVFAPTDLDTRIIHEWQYFDDAMGKWVSATKITFPIKGGRGEGYRGFSKKDNLFPGKWRVDVKTERGQIIGRLRFNIAPPKAGIELEEAVL